MPTTTNPNNPQSETQSTDNLSAFQQMTIENLSDFIAESKYKPLSDKELSKGKSYLKIYGTQDSVPWSTVYQRLASGQPILEVIKQYGHGRKIALWAQQDGVSIDTDTQSALQKGVEARQAIQHIANTDPDTAKTLLQRMNELTPDFQSNVAIFADKIVKKAIDKLDDKYLEPADMEKLANTVQKTTDIIGVTQRHSAGVNINNNEIQVQGFEFVLDGGPPIALTTDATVIEEHPDGD